jgi:flagellin-like hook-associated protein FlgL
MVSGPPNLVLQQTFLIINIVKRAWQYFLSKLEAGMLEIESVFESYFRNQVFSGDYNWSDATYGVPDNDSDIAIIREFLQGNTADIRLSAEQANATVSMVQVFEDAAVAIRDNLILMEALAEDAAFNYHPEGEKASMQNQLIASAENINDIANSTEYDNNKLFGADGKNISEPIGSGYSIKLLAADLRFNTANVDLTKDAKAAWAAVKSALKQAEEFTDYLGSQNRRLQNAMAIIEDEMAGAAGLELSDFETKIAQQIAAYLATSISQNPDIFSQSQSNITPDEASYLLKDN